MGVSINQLLGLISQMFADKKDGKPKGFNFPTQAYRPKKKFHFANSRVKEPPYYPRIPGMTEQNQMYVQRMTNWQNHQWMKAGAHPSQAKKFANMKRPNYKAFTQTTKAFTQTTKAFDNLGKATRGVYDALEDCPIFPGV